MIATEPAFEFGMGVLEGQLRENKYMLGDNYTIVDMASRGWARNGEGILGEGAMAEFHSLKRLVDEIDEAGRPTRIVIRRAVRLQDGKPR